MSTRLWQRRRAPAICIVHNMVRRDPINRVGRDLSHYYADVIERQLATMTTRQNGGGAQTLDRALLLYMYEQMVTIRQFEERAGREFAAGKVPGFVHLYAGEEAVAVGVCASLTDDDYHQSSSRPRPLHCQRCGRARNGGGTVGARSRSVPGQGRLHAYRGCP